MFVLYFGSGLISLYGFVIMCVSDWMVLSLYEVNQKPTKEPKVVQWAYNGVFAEKINKEPTHSPSLLVPS